MIDVLRIAHLRIAPQEGNLEVGNCEGNREDKVCMEIVQKYFPKLNESKEILVFRSNPLDR